MNRDFARPVSPAPSIYLNDTPKVRQILSWGDWEQARLSPPNTPFANTGRHLYVIGDIDGGFRPRSNPYDIHNLGAPSPSDPLANELQGLWAQPLKALDGYMFTVEVNGEIWPLLNATQFTQTFAETRFDFELSGAESTRLKAIRADFVAQDRPILFTTLTLQNDGLQAVDMQLTFSAYFDLEDAWFTSLAGERNSGETVRVSGNRIVARAHSAPDAWAVVVGGDQPAAQLQVAEEPEGSQVGHITTTAKLTPGGMNSWTFAVVVENESGHDTALKHLAEWLPQRETLLAQKQSLYETLLTDAPRLHSPDAHFDMAFDVARANMQMLEAESAPLGRYFYAGLEMFPFWFSNDGAYSLPGLLASNLVGAARNHLLIGAQAHENGRIPHQISPAGHIVVVGNVQETSQWVTAVWDFYRWTGDRDFLETVYPTAVVGLFDYTLGAADSDGDGYPEGPSMVERSGMGPEKLDAVSYLWSALTNLAQMADVLADSETAERARAAAAELQTRFDADWWLPDQGLYADSLGLDNTPRHDGHWTAVVPLEVGIAPPEHGRLALTRIQREYVNEWGLVHTLGDDERVWTLPTATLSRGAYRYRDVETGFAMLYSLAQSLNHGSIGLYHELIPEGLSFFQLWSGATFVRGVVEDLMGIRVRADQHAVTITPQLPADWDFVELEHLTFGEHRISIRAAHDSINVSHGEGSVPLSITYRATDGAETAFVLSAGESSR
jgi:glycogen debranching enzyme